MGYSRTLPAEKRSKNNTPRSKNDFYPTPKEVVRFILQRSIQDKKPVNILDPGAGTGAFGSVARELCPSATIVGVDNLFSWPAAGYNFWLAYNFLDKPPEWLKPFSFDWVIGNPPFKLAQEFVEKSMEMMPFCGTITFLLRLAFLESHKRVDFFKRYPLSEVCVLASRPSFNGTGQTDATAYAVFEWVKWPPYLIAEAPPTKLTWLDWKPKNAAPAKPYIPPTDEEMEAEEAAWSEE